MANKWVYMRGYSKLPYNTINYTLSTNYFLACALGAGMSATDIQFIDIPNAIVVAITYEAAAPIAITW